MDPRQPEAIVSHLLQLGFSPQRPGWPSFLWRMGEKAGPLPPLTPPHLCCWSRHMSRCTLAIGPGVKLSGPSKDIPMWSFFGSCKGKDRAFLASQL